MSHTTIHKITEDGNMSSGIELRNAWRGAMFIWTEIGKAHLEEAKTPFWSALLDSESVWGLFTDERLSQMERAVLGSTFDKVMVKRENLPKFVGHLREFAQKYDAENSSSLLEQASAIEKLLEMTDTYAIAWTQTSVAGDVWWVWDDDDEDFNRYYDYTRDEGHWFLYESEPMRTLTIE